MTSMKSVLMIAYGFPPEGNAGVYRPLRFLRESSVVRVAWTGDVRKEESIRTV